MSELSAWLPPLEPPPGGYTRLTQALDARRLRSTRHHWRARLVLAGSSLAMVALVLAPLLHRPNNPQAQLIASSLQQAWAQGDQELVVDNGAAAELMKAPGLRVYWVGVVGDSAGVRIPDAEPAARP